MSSSSSIKLVLNQSGYSISSGSAALESVSELSSEARADGDSAKLSEVKINSEKYRKNRFLSEQRRSICCLGREMWHRIIDHSQSAPEGFILQGLFEMSIWRVLMRLSSDQIKVVSYDAMR